MSAPVITVQPADVTVATGATATLSVTSTATGGDGVTHYQWYIAHGDSFVAIGDGQNVTGTATNTLSFHGASTANAGRYLCRAYNNAGSVSSQSATVTVTPGTGNTGGGTIATGGILSLGGGTAVMSNWQGIARVAAAGNAGRWKRNGSFSAPRPCGPPVPELQFQEFGDRLTAIWKQPWRVAIENWAAEPRYATHPDRADYYLIKETVPEIRGAGIAVWERWYAPVPQVHFEEEDFSYSYQYFNSGTSLASYTRTVTSRIKYEYFLERDEAAFPLLLQDDLRVQPVGLVINGGETTSTRVALYKTGSGSLYQAAGSLFLISNDPYIVAEPSKITTWNDPIKCRATRYVPGPKLSDLGTDVTPA